jgi:hypothetical protein
MLLITTTPPSVEASRQANTWDTSALGSGLLEVDGPDGPEVGSDDVAHLSGW